MLSMDELQLLLSEKANEIIWVINFFDGLCSMNLCETFAYEKRNSIVWQWTSACLLCCFESQMNFYNYSFPLTILFCV